MREVSYKTFRKFGGLQNPRFMTRPVYSQGKYWYTKYIDTFDTELYYIGKQ